MTTGSSGGSEQIPELDCADLCTTLSENTCLSGAQGFPRCEDECVRVLDGQFADTHPAFAECVATNALCFSTPEQCVWQALYPDPIAGALHYTGTGFETFEGMTVRGGLREEFDAVDIVETVVEAGTVSLELAGPLLVHRAHAVVLYVDTDDDGLCTRGIDFAVSESVEVSGEFDAPVFAHIGPAPKASQDFVCDAF